MRRKVQEHWFDQKLGIYKDGFRKDALDVYPPKVENPSTERETGDKSMSAHNVNAMQASAVTLVDALAKIIGGNERFVNHDQALSVTPAKALKTEQLWLVKSSRPAPCLMMFQSGNQGGESTFFVAIFVISEESTSVYVNKEILPGECKEEGCWCNELGHTVKSEFLPWLEKNAPQVQVVMVEEHQLSALYYDGFVEFFADTIKNQAEQASN